jgi:hypothetical protein
VKYKERFKSIARALILLVESYKISELRAPKSDRGPQSGLFDDPKKMAKAAAKLGGDAPGIYFCLNPIKESLVERVTNDVRKKRSAVKDADIARRKWLPIDFDPIRRPNIPSTDLEHKAALAKARACRRFLRDLGWSTALLCDSGNGAHLLYPIDLPNDEASTYLIKTCLQVLSMMFSDSTVLVDIENFNASRIFRVYGTLNCKGKATDDRPYRRAQLLEVPDELKTVSVEQLNQLAMASPITATRNPAEQLDVDGWIADNRVPVEADAPWNGGGHKWILQCPWNESHRNKSAYIVQFPDGGIAAGCLHSSCAGRNWPDLRRRYEPRSGSDTMAPVGQVGAPPKLQTRASKADLVEMASDLELFSTPQGETYARVRVRNHWENHRIKSQGFTRYLRYVYFLQAQTAPKTQAVQDAVAHLDAVARYDSPTNPVSIRVAPAGAVKYLDLADADWRAVEFSVEGWSIVEAPVARFRRVPGMLSLPTPITGGNINDLKKFLNFRSDDDWILFVTDLLAAMMSTGPYPVQGIHGEAGSAKTTTLKVYRAMIDPNVSPSRGIPKDIRDLMIMANNSWVLSFDNLSYLPAWFSDCLCRLSTGGGFSTRQLYSDDAEMIFDGLRPVILNGIEELPTRTDLLDRSLLFDLPLIARYRDEKTLWQEFEAARPRLLGALLDVAVETLRNVESVQLKEKPRMADFAILATAAEPALRLSNGQFIRAYNQNRQNANAIALEASPIASLARELAQEGRWTGTADKLLRTFSKMVGEDTSKSRSWPKNPRVLSGMLRRLATALRRAGVDVDFSRARNDQRTRMISIEQRKSKVTTRA